MEIEKATAGDATTLTLKGEIDLHASPALRAELRSCAEAKAKVLLVDFTGVEYIDSSGLATFIEYLREANGHGGRIALFGLKKKVRTIFDLVRLNELFTITDSAEEALAALAAK
jgi:anti-sigma B factor antagonist